MAVLVIAEHDNRSLKPATLNAVTAAAGFGVSVDVLVAGHQAAAVAQAAAAVPGVVRVLHADATALAGQLAENVAAQVVAVAGEYDTIVFPATAHGKNVAPRVAALLDVAQISDVTRVVSMNTFERPIYAGNAIVTVEVPADQVVVATVRTASWQEAARGGNAAVETTTVQASLPTHTRFVGLAAGSTDRPDLQSAKRVVSGGRGVGSEENFKVIYALADKLGAAVGASRAAVDAGYVPNELQVGQTGKIIAPELYVAVGISGAIQHLTGIKDAGTIVAINKDGDAPIFEIADIGLVGDLFQLLPELEAALG